MENYFAEYKLELQETLSLIKILQIAVQNKTNYAEFHEIDDSLEIVKNILDKLIAKAELLYNELFNVNQ